MLAGTARQDRLNPNEPTPELGAPDMPAGLTEQEQAYWRDLLSTLEAQGVLYRTHGEAMLLAVKAQGEFLRADEECRRDGETQIVLTQQGDVLRNHPAVKRRTEAWTRYLRVLQEFGLTPASMTRVSATKPKPKEDEKTRRLREMFGK